MALWKDAAPARRDSALAVSEPLAPREDLAPAPQPAWDTSRRTVEAKESLIGAQLAIEGKIQGAGHVRIAGRFTGDVQVEGNLTIEAGATVHGGVTANAVIIAGELQGNVLQAASVELLSTGVMVGDLRAGSLVVAAGSRMRGHVEFGWRHEDGVGERNGSNAL
ncbi:MAG: polymer-forming cytoskeletal protein [Gemmatimonadetes bacterium]|nr:polymer-forming cytoskeletal protein [Gemmatimonadota bacterium]